MNICQEWQWVDRDNDVANTDKATGVTRGTIVYRDSVRLPGIGSLYSARKWAVCLLLDRAIVSMSTLQVPGWLHPRSAGVTSAGCFPLAPATTV